MRKFITFLSVFIFFSCSENQDKKQMELTGYAQGSTFQIKYLDEKERDFLKEIQSLFVQIDTSMSTYDSTSAISKINRGDTVVVDSLFLKVLKRSLEIAEETGGIFDPTVGPLVEFWGFGPEAHQNVDSTKVDSVKNFIGYRGINIDGNSVYLNPGYKLDFNAIAQGFTVDVIAEFLEKSSIDNYMVEVGGEIIAKGFNKEDQIWRVGIDKPLSEMDEEDRLQAVIALKNAALATSGNYRKYWVDEETGMKYSHTINPISGFPARNRLLSVTIIAPTGMDADAYATVCMAKGVRASIEFLKQKNDLEGYLIYSNEDGEWEEYFSEGFSKFLVK